MLLCRLGVPENFRNMPLPRRFPCHAIFFAALAAGIWLRPVSLSGEEGLRPNVVLIVADDLGYSDLGCYGQGRMATPHCDRLAEGGMRFTDMHSSSGVCTPSRYSLLTGRYAWRTWLKDWVINQRMPLLIEEGRLTMPMMFQRRGYATACIGKWHLGWGRRPNAFQDGVLSPGPNEVGFDYFYGLPYSHNTRSDYSQAEATDEMNVYVRNDRIVGLGAGEDIMDPAAQERLTRDRDRVAEQLSAEAVQWIEKRADEPFFLYYPTAHVHGPLTPGPRFKGKSGEGAYEDFVLEFDWIVGEIVGVLERRRILENTLIIVTSDNGSVRAVSNQPWRGIKGEVYEGGHRVPFIAHWPDAVEAGSASDALLGQQDLFRTFAALLDFPVPASAGEDSYDFLPLLMGRGQSEVRPDIIHHSVMGTFALRRGPWKYIQGVGGGRESVDGGPSVPFDIFLYADEAVPDVDPATGEVMPWSFKPRLPRPQPGQASAQLYNIQQDPQESLNLIDSRPAKAELLETLLETYRRIGRSAPM